jgi:Xaa-Pro dipeptidase
VPINVRKSEGFELTDPVRPAGKPGLHFSEQELTGRRQRVAGDLRRRGLDGILLFRQESMYYLTGYDGFGYVFFQCLYLAADGETMTLLARAPELRQAQYTSIVPDVRIWYDAEGANPTTDLRRILEEHRCAGHRLGIETDSYGLTGFNLRRVEAALEGFVSLVDASDLVNRLRVVKSPAEIEYVRTAADLADRAFGAAVDVAGPGVFEGAVLAAQQAAMFEGGGDFPANDNIIGSGPRALLVRSTSGMRVMDVVDQLTMEWAGVYRRYHAVLMRSFAIGRASADQQSLFGIVADAIVQMTDALAPGRPIGDVDDAHRRVLDAAGLAPHRFGACGYSLGTTYGPNWMDWPMLYSGNPVIGEPGMVFFLHCVVVDSDRGLAMTYGHTCLITPAGREILSTRPLELIVA